MASNMPILFLCLIVLCDLFVQGGHQDGQRYCGRGSDLSSHR